MLLIELSLQENLQEIVINQFSRVAQTGRCSFTGNGSLGSSVSLSELREIYDVVRYQLLMKFFADCGTWFVYCLQMVLVFDG